MTTRQTELMDFIILLKNRKRELKKNLTLQKDRMLDCFQEIRNCLDFYQKQVERVVTEQFTRLTTDIKKQINESKLKAAYLEEEGNQLSNKAKLMSKFHRIDIAECRGMGI